MYGRARANPMSNPHALIDVRWAIGSLYRGPRPPCVIFVPMRGSTWPPRNGARTNIPLSGRHLTALERCATILVKHLPGKYALSRYFTTRAWLGGDARLRPK